MKNIKKNKIIWAAFMLFVLISVSACTSSTKNNYSKIVGDWELVKVETSTVGQTTADEFANLKINALNGSMEAMKLIYSFSATKGYMRYGTLRGVNGFAEDLFKGGF